MQFSSLATRRGGMTGARRAVLPDPAALGAAGKRQAEQDEAGNGGKTAVHDEVILWHDRRRRESVPFLRSDHTESNGLKSKRVANTVLPPASATTIDQSDKS